MNLGCLALQVFLGDQALWGQKVSPSLAPLVILELLVNQGFLALDDQALGGPLALPDPLDHPLSMVQL